MEDALLIYNPRAGSWRTPRLADSIRTALSEAYRLVDRPTSRPGHATELARRGVDDGVGAVFAFGGDGTLRETAVGLLDSDVPLGAIPGGTVNVIAGALGIPSNPVAAARALCRAGTVDFDVGLCGERPFLMAASFGLDAKALITVDPELKRLLGKGAVAWSGLNSWVTYDYPRFEVVAAGREMNVTFAAVCNLPDYGGVGRMSRAARTDDGLLDLVVFTGEGRTDTFGFVRDFLLGRHHRRDDVEVLQVERAEVKGPPGLALQLDGDAIDAHYPISLQLAPHRVRLFAPAGSPR